MLARAGRAFVFTDTDGRFLAASLVRSTSALWLQRFLSNGIPDRSFHEGVPLSMQLPPAAVPAADVALWLTGTVVDKGTLLVLSGVSQTGSLQASIVRMTPEGELDVRFGNGGFFSLAGEGLTAIVGDSRNRIVVAGGGRARAFVRRYVLEQEVTRGDRARRLALEN